jgi:hypothetical protein
MNHYSINQIWRLDQGNGSDSFEINDFGGKNNDEDVSYLSVACEMAARFLKKNLTKVSRESYIAHVSPKNKQNSISDTRYTYKYVDTYVDVYLYNYGYLYSYTYIYLYICLFWVSCTL